ncbi:hypothetical protein [Flexivirga alba]|uniref:YNCE-like beta-propeller domain-containing protein n=1 Tax=Flexivirga alba TaxID=702742 RepID=A0ABW2ALP2_9MICO
MSRTSRVVLAAVATTTLAACSTTSTPAHTSSATAAPAAAPRKSTPPAFGLAPDGLPVYAHTNGTADISAVARRARDLVYVPEQLSGRVQVIDPHTFKIIATYDVAASPEHVVPGYDERTLWVNSDAGNRLTPINPVTGKPGRAIPVAFPYNLYFTPGGKHALVMAEALNRIDVRNPHTMALQRTLHVPCNGVNHADFTADLTTFVASCEFSGKLLVINSDATKIKKVIDLNAIHTPGATDPKMAKSMGGPAASLNKGASSMPQDVRLAPDGRHYLVADMLRNGVWVFDARTFAEQRFIPTGKGAHGIYPSRDGKRIFVSNRDEGSISVLDARTLNPIAKWRIPGGGSPDMGGLSADGSQLWLSGRYNSVVYVFDTRTGKLIHRIAVDPGPHGLLVWPQPGRFSLGHTGNMR